MKNVLKSTLSLLLLLLLLLLLTDDCDDDHHINIYPYATTLTTHVAH